MLHISKKVIFDNDISKAIAELMTYKMGLHYCERLAELRNEFTDLYSLGKNLFYIQVAAWGGTVPRGSEKYHFDDPIKKQLFEAELYTFLSGTKELDRAPTTVYIDNVSQELIDTLEGVVDIHPTI